MDQLNLLILLSFSMLIGAFFSGTVPMTFKMSDSKSRLLALMGSGILVGTALAVIIPEGIDSIYVQPAKQSFIGQDLSSDSENKKDSKVPQYPQEPPIKTWTIGLSLVAGFILMLLIDQFSLYQTREDNIVAVNSKSNSMHSYSLANQDDDCEEIDINQEEDIIASDDESKVRGESKGTHQISMRGISNSNHGSSSVQPALTQPMSRNTKVTPTLGLVIHASADGIALGAAATTSHRDVEMIIFLAIMLHKAPAAFSLVVLLLHKGLKHSTIRRHLLAFSLSAPIAALLTYFGLSQSGKEALRRNNATGIAMLFSAGTFLYVATVHVLPDLLHNKLLSPKELSFLVGGAFLPILLTLAV